MGKLRASEKNRYSLEICANTLEKDAQIIKLSPPRLRNIGVTAKLLKFIQFCLEMF